MESRSSYYHQTRYAAQPTHPQSQPQPHYHPFPSNPNVYRPNIHAAAPPPLRPQAQQLSQPPPAFHPAPSPQSFNFQNSHFANDFSPNHHPRPRSLQRPDIRNFTESPRVLHPNSFDDDRPRRLPDYVRENRSDVRVFPDRRSTRPYSHANLDNQPLSPMNIRHELESNSRFIEEHNQREELLLARADDHYHRPNQFGSTSDRTSRDFRTVSNQLNHTSPFENLHGQLNEDQRWVHERDVTDMGNDDMDDSDGIRIGSASVKREPYRFREVNAELERHSNRGSREGSYEFTRTPRKQQQQKKSVLLRIQKPNYRNREDDRVHYSGYFDDTKSSFRGKDQNLYQDRDMGEQERHGSPVELDVSFKSNSLVAKAIVTPSSNSTGVYDSNLTPKNEKVRKALVLNKDGSGSTPPKPNEGIVELENAMVSNFTSNSEKDLKQLREEVIASSFTDEHNGSPQPDCSGAKVLPLKSKLENCSKDTVSNKRERNAFSGKPLKVAKKKKIVKRVVKKVVDPGLSSSNSQPINDSNETSIVTTIVHGLPASSGPSKDAAMASADIVDSQLCTSEKNLMLEDDRVEGLAEGMTTVNGINDDSARLCIPGVKKKRKLSASPSGSSSHAETKIDDNIVHGTSANINNMNLISETDAGSTKSLDENTSFDLGTVENSSKQLCQNMGLSLPENNTQCGFPKLLPSAEFCANFDSFSPDQTKIHESTNACKSSLVDEHKNCLINSPGVVTVSDIQTTDACCEQPLTSQGSPSSKNGILDKYQNIDKIHGQSNSGEVDIQNAATSASCSREELVTVSSSDNGPTVSGEIKISSHGPSDIHKQSSPDRVTIPLQDVARSGSLSCMVSGSGSKKGASKILKRKKNVEAPQLDLSKSDVNDIYVEPVNMVNSGRWVDTTLRLSFKDNIRTDFTDSGNGCGDVELQSSTDGVIFLPQKSSMDLVEVSTSGCSINNVSSASTLSQNSNKRELADSQLELTCQVASDLKEGPLSTFISAPIVGVASNSCNAPIQSEVDTQISVLDTVCDSCLPSINREVTASVHCSGGGYQTAATLLRDAIEDGGLKDTHSCSAAADLAVLEMQSGLECQQITDASVMRPSFQNDSVRVGCQVRRMDVDAEQPSVVSGNPNFVFPSGHHPLDLDDKLLNMDVEVNCSHHEKNDLPSVSYLSSSRDGSGSSSCDELMGLVPVTVSGMNSLEALPDLPSTSHNQLSIKKDVGSDATIFEKPVFVGHSNISTLTSSSPNTENNLNSDPGVENDKSLGDNTEPLPSEVSMNSTQILTPISGEKYGRNEEKHGRKEQPIHAVSRIYPGRSSFGLTAKNAASSTHASKSRTWHRTDNTSNSASPANKVFLSTIPTQRKMPKRMTKLQSTSYIRKGNSLVRNPIQLTGQSRGSNRLSSVHQLNSLGTDEVKKNAGSDTSTTVVDPSNFVRTGVYSSFERPRTPPLPSATKMPNHATSALGNHISSPSVEPLHDCAAEFASDPMTSPESNDVLKSSDDVVKNVENSMNQVGEINLFDHNNETNDGNLVSSNVNIVTYVKRKLNQLVATSNPHSLSVNNVPAIPTDGYFKRRKNQLIRTSMECHIKSAVGMPDESLSSGGKSLHDITSSRSLSKRKLHKDLTKTRKLSKFPFVWTLWSSQSSNDYQNALSRQKVLPHLFPWKRATYWRSCMPVSAANSGNSSSSTISRKLLLLRKRDAVYTRSKHGFSLRKSKVLSVGGSSLKWSKSIESRSKKVNEEATLAVAEAERKKREQGDVSRAIPGTKHKNSSRERIFRIGSDRYKMDSSRQTLQRISDDESPGFTTLQTEKDAKRSYVPRRLVIGKDEYVRIGNGNQLVRDPKKRTRILASEKVRWSLHTARSRLARKRKYCQFFTRFGKCNKDDGKCPYIHDPSKIAVCTKFLNGLCSNTDCKLTHKVIPERMPDCSYFLQGLCSNKDCPYRHVHVNPNAPTCEGFLRGYCADGDECRKKHSHVCPAYEATGSCPQGSKCKLHHPKNRSKGKKNKQSRQKKKGQDRYFGSMNINLGQPGTAVSEIYSVHDNNIGSKGSIADYIGLDFICEEGETSIPVMEQTFIHDSGPMDFQLVDIDELIKPIRIMNA